MIGIAFAQSIAPPLAAFEQAAERGKAAGALSLFVLVGVVLLLVFLVGAVVLVWTARRRRAFAGRRRPTPTPAEDVWAMHKLPDDTDRDETE